MNSFDFVCLGAGGGPSETDLSAYLLKTSDSFWEDGIVAIEAGSGIGALSRILSRPSEVFSDIQSITDAEETPELLAARLYSYIQTFLISHSHLDHVLSLVLSSGSLPRPPPLHAQPVYRRRIMGTKQVLDDLAIMVFSDRIWPNLASWSAEVTVPEYMYLYESLPIHYKLLPSMENAYHPINTKISVLAMPVSHGLCRSHHAHAPSGTYTSTAFFIRHALTRKQFLFFGDVEPDSLASNPSTREVWRVAASLIASSIANGQRMLDSIFIECSWPTTRPDKELYGHLNPQHLLHEMKVLASEAIRYNDTQLSAKPSNNVDGDKLATSNDVNKKKRRKTIFRRSHKTTEPNVSNGSTTTASMDPLSSIDPSQLVDALSGIKLYVIHCKAPMQATPGVANGTLSQHIAGELRSLVDKEGLGLEVIAMEQGMRIQI